MTNLLLAGRLDRSPGIRVIVPHAGVALPVLADRIVGLSSAVSLPNPVEPDRFFATLRRLDYDLVGFPQPRLAPALLQIAGPAHHRDPACGRDGRYGAVRWRDTVRRAA